MTASVYTDGPFSTNYASRTNIIVDHIGELAVYRDKIYKIAGYEEFAGMKMSVDLEDVLSWHRTIDSVDYKSTNQIVLISELADYIPLMTKEKTNFLFSF